MLDDLFAPGFGQSMRMLHVEKQLNAGLDFVDVLSAGPAAPCELEMQSRSRNGEMIIDVEIVGHKSACKIQNWQVKCDAPGSDVFFALSASHIALHFHSFFAKLNKYPYCPAGGGVVGVECFLPGRYGLM